MKQRIGHSAHRGFATIFAVVMLGLVATALTSAALLARDDARRTQDILIGAQLRQLLLAGVADAVERSRNWGDATTQQKWSVALPADSRLEGALLSGAVESTLSGSIGLHIRAEIAGRRMDEVLQFLREGAAWKLAGIHLEPRP